MNTAIVSVVVLYLLVALGLGLWARGRSRRSSEDYFLADRSLSWVHLALTLFATWMSTFAFLGSPGFYFQNGVGWFLPHAFLVVGSPILLWFMGRKIWYMGRKYGYITPGDMLADFYQSDMVRYLVAIISLLALLPYSLIQLVGIGKVLESSTGGTIPYELGIAFAVVGITIYTYIGGIRAIVLTDILQAVLFGILLLLGAGIAVSVAGGLSEGFTSSVAAKPDAFKFSPSKVGSPFTLLIIWTFGYILLPHMWQRAYMAESPQAISRSVVLGSVLALLVVALPSLLMGTLGIGFLPDLADPDNLVPTLYENYLPVLLPAVVLATFAAGMSTVDSQLLSASSVFVRDIAQPLSENEISSAREKSIGRYLVLGLIFILTVLALSPESQGPIVLLASKGTGIALLLLVPLCGPLLWQEASRTGAVASLVMGGGVLVGLEITSFSLPLSFGPPIGALIAQVPTFVGGSLLYPSQTLQSAESLEGELASSTVHAG